MPRVCEANQQMSGAKPRLLVFLLLDRGVFSQHRGTEFLHSFGRLPRQPDQRLPRSLPTRVSCPADVVQCPATELGYDVD